LIRIFAAAALAFSLGAGVLVGTNDASAQSPSQRECEAAGGTFSRDRGEVSCVVTEEGKNDRFEREETTTGRGNINNKTEQTEECTGTGSGKCPPGQFR
jgi:hypothetical protein